MEKDRGLPQFAWPWLFITVATVSLVAGCESTDSGRSPISSFSRTDSAGIPILTTMGEEALASLGWTVDPIPDVVIGTGTAEGEQFYRIQGIRGLDGGGILVVDGGSRQLRFFDPQGSLLHLVGRKGEGPGEFEDPILVPLLGVDSLLVWDRYLKRFQYFAEDGRSNHTQRLQERWPSGANPPHGAVGRMMLLREQDAPFIFLPPSLTKEGPKETVSNLLWYDPVSRFRLPITSHTVTGHFAFIRPDRPPTVERIPFTVFPSATVTPDGGLVTQGRTFEITDFGLEGEVRRILRLDLPGRPVTEAITEAWMDSEIARRGDDSGLLEEVLSSMPIPDTLPAFEALLSGELGCIWAQIYDWDPVKPRQWVVFNGGGKAIGTLQTPPGLRVEWVGSDAILGVWKDEKDVEYVHRHELRRK